MAGVVLIGAIAVFVSGLLLGILLASIAMRREDRRAWLIRKVRGLRPGLTPRHPGPSRQNLDTRFSQSGGP
jgi:hypothetical protein